MEQRDLQAFLQLADTLHFARAAAASHMTPSTLSRLIKRLEQELGVTLFMRDKRQVQLTYHGEQFREYARDSVARWQTLHSRLHQLDRSELEGSLSIYGSVTASYSVLAHILPKVRESYPGIEIQLRTGDQADALVRIIEGVDDLAIAAVTDDWPVEVAFQPLTRARLTLIVPSMTCAVRDLVSVGEVDWQALPFIVPEQGVARQRLEQWWLKAGIQPPVYAYVSGHEAVVSMVALGCGVALVPDLVVAHSPLQEHIESRVLEQVSQPFDIGLCAQSARMDRPVQSAVWDLVKENSGFGR